MVVRPNMNMQPESHQFGRNFLRRMLDGISKTT